MYWRNITKRINKHLSGARVIKDRTDAVWEPNCLMFLDWAHDRNGEPIFDHICHHVSPDYPDSVRGALLSLGVTAPDWSWVCDKLHELHRKGLLSTKMRNTEWCSDLAKVILEPKDPKGDKKYAIDLRGIPLIPLEDGTWRCPPSKDEPIYFPASLGTNIPPGLPLLLVDWRACACPKRRKLFRLQGVKDCDVPNVLEWILDYHAKFVSAKAVHLIAQLNYLYKMRDHLRPGDMEKIYFDCSTSKHYQKGNMIYADVSVGGELQQLFSEYSEAYFLDSRYFTEFNIVESARVVEWLSQTTRMASRPRIISINSVWLHKDFEWLLDNKNDQVLAILRQHWGFYSKEITSIARYYLGGREFVCKSGVEVALR